MEKTERFKAAEREFEERIAENGWCAHYVPVDDDHINYHTHGATVHLDHSDIQITLALGMDSANFIGSHFMNRIKGGMKYEEGVRYMEPLRPGYLDCPVFFKKFMECGRDVLRVILPDVNNLLPGEKGCVAVYECQLDDLDNLPNRKPKTSTSP